MGKQVSILMGELKKKTIPSSQRSGFFEFAGNNAGEGKEIQSELESPMIDGANHMVG